MMAWCNKVLLLFLGQFNNLPINAVIWHT